MQLKHLVLSLFVSSIFWGKVQAQSIDDPLTFSKEDNGGSARIKGLGNAQTALGGDISSINGNPAGLGFFSQSDASITTNFLNSRYKTDFLGSKNTSKKNNFGIDQAGVVFNFPTANHYYETSGWQNFNVGISYNKTQNFNNRLIYEGINNATSYSYSLIDIMENNRNGTFEKDFAGSNLVDVNKDGLYYPLAIGNKDKGQYNEILSSGNRSKTTLAFGANYNNTLYVGGSIGFTSLQYDNSSKFIENGWIKGRDAILAENPDSPFGDPKDPRAKYVGSSYEMFDVKRQQVDGSGIDAKIGVIYKPTTDWNIGVTINTPTWLNIKEDELKYTDIDYYEDATSNKHIGKYESKSYYKDGNYRDYNLITPWKFSAGVTKFFSRGLVTVDADLVTYNTLKYTNSLSGGSSSVYSGINKTLKDTYKTAANFRIGGEYLFSNLISGRAGFNYIGNPYKNSSDKNYSGSLGLGFKLTQNIYADVAVLHQINSYKQAAYSFDENYWNAGSPVADIKLQRTSALLTLGAKF